MGVYVNPGNIEFYEDSSDNYYVDKTAMIGLINQNINTTRKYIAVSRARRFGKTMIADMLKAYYSAGCDSEAIFNKFEISKDKSYKEHLNRYEVIYFDTASFLGEVKDNTDDLVKKIVDTISNELKETYGDAFPDNMNSLHMILSQIYNKTNKKFIIIIDEWDCIIRDTNYDVKLIDDYLMFLRGLFKSAESRSYLALGYITGILPIKKMKGESAMNNFLEYTMAKPGKFAPFFGFTRDELTKLCEIEQVDIEEIKEWYDGYKMSDYHIYNPNSVISALEEKKIDSYWKNTSSFESINELITRNFSGLKDAILQMMTGENYKLDIETFKNDLHTFSSKDEVLTALIHLGFLGYDDEKKAAFIPNKEVRIAFNSALSVGNWSDVKEALSQSDRLLQATLEEDELKVCEMIEASQMDYSSIIKYNDENSLACAVMMAYYTAREGYIIIRELPSGRGYADIAFIPKKNNNNKAFIVELKWNKDVDTAISQIKNKKYAGALKEYQGNMLLVGINYDKETDMHTCKIERY